MTKNPEWTTNDDLNADAHDGQAVVPQAPETEPEKLEDEDDETLPDFDTAAKSWLEEWAPDREEALYHALASELAEAWQHGRDGRVTLPPSRKAREAKPGRVYRIVETDNFGGDYPNESFEGPNMTYLEAERVAEMFNKTTGADRGGSRFYKVEHESYKLQPGFEP